MSAASAIISSLRARNFTLSAAGGVKVRPFSRLTDDDKRTIIANKSAIIEELERERVQRHRTVVAALARIEALADAQPTEVRQHIGAYRGRLRIGIV